MEEKNKITHANFPQGTNKRKTTEHTTTHKESRFYFGACVLGCELTLLVGAKGGTRNKKNNTQK